MTGLSAMAASSLFLAAGIARADPAHRRVHDASGAAAAARWFFSTLPADHGCANAPVAKPELRTQAPVRSHYFNAPQPGRSVESVLLDGDVQMTLLRWDCGKPAAQVWYSAPPPAGGLPPRDWNSSAADALSVLARLSKRGSARWREAREALRSQPPASGFSYAGPALPLPGGGTVQLKSGNVPPPLDGYGLTVELR